MPNCEVDTISKGKGPASDTLQVNFTNGSKNCGDAFENVLRDFFRVGEGFDDAFLVRRRLRNCPEHA